jgi:hypothetical protein
VGEIEQWKGRERQQGMGEEDFSFHLGPESEPGKSFCCISLFRLWQWKARVKSIRPSSLKKGGVRIWDRRKPGDREPLAVCCFSWWSC